MRYSAQQIENAVIGAVDEVIGQAIDQNDFQKDLIEDLGMDSLDVVDFIIKLEKSFDPMIDIPDEDAERFKRPADAVSYLKNRFGV